MSCAHWNDGGEARPRVHVVAMPRDCLWTRANFAAACAAMLARGHNARAQQVLTRLRYARRSSSLHSAISPEGRKIETATRQLLKAAENGDRQGWKYMQSRGGETRRLRAQLALGERLGSREETQLLIGLVEPIERSSVQDFLEASEIDHIAPGSFIEARKYVLSSSAYHARRHSLTYFL